MERCRGWLRIAFFCGGRATSAVRAKDQDKDDTLPHEDAVELSDPGLSHSDNGAIQLAHLRHRQPHQGHKNAQEAAQVQQIHDFSEPCRQSTTVQGSHTSVCPIHACKERCVPEEAIAGCGHDQYRCAESSHCLGGALENVHHGVVRRTPETGAVAAGEEQNEPRDRRQGENDSNQRLSKPRPKPCGGPRRKQSLLSSARPERPD
mmetsp:Transcript_98129/g.253784  ORF Transcript_98129/g.253784 Transcript_98129/m.253784 type:complete len:205 (+) Transcript_98129:757-1371(+)